MPPCSSCSSCVAVSTFPPPAVALPLTLVYPQGGVCFGIRAGIYLGNALGHTKEALDRAASLWPDVPSAAVQNVVYDWDKVAEARNQTNQ